MIHPDILAALARRARQARRHRQPGRAPATSATPLRRLRRRSLRPGVPRRLAAEGTPVVLRDGSAVLVRQIRSTDAPLLADGFARLSPRSRRMRFLSTLSDRARQVGIHRFTALADAENVAVAGLARKLGARLAGRGPGTMEYEVALVPAEYSLDWWFSCVDGSAQPVADQSRSTRGRPSLPRLASSVRADTCCHE